MFLELFVFVFVMLFSNDVWTVYGIVVDTEGAPVNPGLSSSSQSNDTIATPVAPFGFPHAAALRSSTHRTLVPNTPNRTTIARLLPAEASTSYLSSTASTSASVPPVPPADPSPVLTPGAKAGIGITAGLLSIVFALVFLEACYMRRKRRDRAILRAIEEVERGMSKSSQEQIVLESRVSIIFDDDTSDEEGRGRHGMLLPRRN